MAVGREAIYTALFNVLQNTPGLMGASRVWRSWSNVAPAEQPFLMLREVGEDYRWTLGGKGPPIITLIANVIVYARFDDRDVPSATALNDFLDGLEDNLQSSVYVGIQQSLGGLVRWCRIQGRQTLYMDSMQQQSMTVLEIHTEAMGAGTGPQL